MLLHRTRVKICGLTREIDVDAAVQAGADAVGFILYFNSTRAVSIERAVQLAKRLPVFVTPVLLLVNAHDRDVVHAKEAIPHAILQFHGDEAPKWCEQWKHSYIKAGRVQDDTDLLEYKKRYSSAQAILLDTHSNHFGGSGKVFDWSIIPKEIAHQVVLAGGLNAANVGRAIAEVQPWAVDVSSGVEEGPGLKDPEAINQFIQAVRVADACLSKKEPIS